MKNDCKLHVIGKVSLQSVLDMAKEAYCSCYHFIRLFSSITGVAPKKYLLRRRLTESITDLQVVDKNISTIAFEYQFGSHEVYTRSFKKYFGCSPSKLRQGVTISNHLIFQRMTKDYIFQSKEVRNSPPEFIEVKKKMMVGLSYFKEGNLENLDLSAE